MKQKPKPDTLTKEQHDLCYEIQFAIMRSINNLDHDKLWPLIQKAIEREVSNEN